MRQNEWVGKRNAVRQNCQMRAEMRFLDGRQPAECTIVDISATGCRIDLADESEIPEDFDLFIPSRSETKIAKVRRQSGKSLGVAFLKSRLDDPMVMQTLLERVSRLERGYAEMKAHGVPSAAARPAAGGEDAVAPVAVAGAPVDASFHKRLDAIGIDVSALKVIVQELSTDAAKKTADPAIRASEFAMEVTGLKAQMSMMGEALRLMTGGSGANAAEVATDLVKMKSEMQTLSRSMREMAQQMPQTQVTVQAGGSGGGDIYQLAKIKADISLLKASIEAQQGGADVTPVPMAKLEELEQLRDDIADLRRRIDAVRETPAVAAVDSAAVASVETLRADLSRLRDDMLIRIATNEPVSINGLRSEIASLRADVQARPMAPPTAVEAPRASFSGGDHARDIEALKRDIQRLTEAVEDVRAAGPADVADLRASVRTLILLVSRTAGRAQEAA